jgi:hypothetical protein
MGTRCCLQSTAGALWRRTIADFCCFEMPGLDPKYHNSPEIPPVMLDVFPSIQPDLCSSEPWLILHKVSPCPLRCTGALSVTTGAAGRPAEAPSRGVCQYGARFQSLRRWPGTGTPGTRLERLLLPPPPFRRPVCADWGAGAVAVARGVYAQLHHARAGSGGHQECCGTGGTPSRC